MAFTLMHLVLLELDTHHFHLDFKLPDVKTTLLSQGSSISSY